MTISTSICVFVLYVLSNNTNIAIKTTTSITAITVNSVATHTPQNRSSRPEEEIESLKADILRLQVEKREAESAGKEFLSRNKGLQKELEEMMKSVGLMAADAKAKEEQKTRDGDTVIVEVEQQKEQEKVEKEQMKADHAIAVEMMKKELTDHINVISMMKTDHAKAIEQMKSDHSNAVATMKTDHATAMETMKSEMTTMNSKHEAMAATQEVLEKELVQQKQQLQEQLHQQEKDVVQLQQRLQEQLQEQLQQHQVVITELETARDKAVKGTQHSPLCPLPRNILSHDRDRRIQHAPFCPLPCNILRVSPNLHIPSLKPLSRFFVWHYFHVMNNHQPQNWATSNLNGSPSCNKPWKHNKHN